MAPFLKEKKAKTDFTLNIFYSANSLPVTKGSQFVRKIMELPLHI